MSKKKEKPRTSNDLFPHSMGEAVTIHTPGKVRARDELETWCRANFKNLANDDAQHLRSIYDAWARRWPQAYFEHTDGSYGFTVTGKHDARSQRVGAHVAVNSAGELNACSLLLKRQEWESVCATTLVSPGDKDKHLTHSFSHGTFIKDIWKHAHPAALFKGTQSVADELMAAMHKNAFSRLEQHFKALNPEKAAELRALVQRGVMRQRKSALRSFAARANQPAVTAAIKSRALSPQTYNWISKANTPELAQRRQRFAITYPVLQAMVTNQKDVRQLVDDGLPVVAAASKHLHCKPATVKALIDRTGGQLPREMVHNIASYAPSLDSVPTSWWPEHKVGWRNYVQHHKIATSFGAASGRPYAELVKETQGNWGSVVRDGATATQAEETSDYVTAVFRKVIAPFVVRAAADAQLDSTQWMDSLGSRHSIATAAWDMFKGRQMREIIKFSHAWHKRQNDLQVRSSSIGIEDEASWQPLTDQLTAPNGVKLTPLISAGALKAEGAWDATGMCHCVHSYAEYCLSGNYHIYHLSTADRPLMATLTVEHTQNAGQFELKIVQNKSEQNAPPPAPAKDAATWLVESVNKGSLVVEWNKVLRERAKVRTNGVIGYDPFDLEKHDKAYTIFRPVLPSTTQATTLEDWSRRMQIPAYVSRTLAKMPKLEAAA